jgi:hypothetical protein
MAAANRRTGQAALAGIGLAAVLAAGIVGGVVGGRVATMDAIQGAPNQVLAPGAQGLPKAAAADRKWIDYGTTWENQYRAQHPDPVDARWTDYGRTWENQYRAQHPAR